MKGLRWIPLFLAIIAIGISDVHAEQVVFSEINYHPSGALPEYIEIANNTATPLDIAEWRLSDGVDYVFPAFSVAAADLTFLMPYERIVLTAVDEATFRAAYAVSPAIRVYGPWSGSLKNGGERITLRDKNGTLVCTMEYDDRGRWPVAADGTGHTLVLRNPDGKIDDWRNWTVSGRPGGTPGSEEIREAETAVADPEVNLSAGIPFVNYGDTWRYNDKNVDLGTAWQAAAFNDSAWPQGPGLLGFENASMPAPGMRTTFTNSQQLTFYVRTRFTYNGSLKGVTLTIDQVVDDGVVYYLNGQEIGRYGMPTGAVTFTTTAGRTVSDAVEELAVITVSNPPLVNGVNVLAAEIHQNSTGSSDIVFGARLNLSVPTQPSLQINEVLPDVAGVGFVEFYNPGTGAINLRDYYLTDDPANLRKFRITDSLTVPAGGLASVGYTESGLALASPVKVYLVAADGATVINAISAAMPMDGRSLGRKPAGGSSWFLFTDPTRGTPNVSESAIAAELHLNEVHFNGTRRVDWVELYNSGDEAVSLDGMSLSSKADFSDKVALSGSVPAGGYASQSVAFALSGSEVTLFLSNGGNRVLSARAFERPSLGDCLQAFPAGSNEWYASTQSTRGATNAPAMNTDIVINEIMYDPPSDEPTGEFVELYNRGTAAADVSGWQFVEGVDFTIPDGTVIPSDDYLVVAADANWARASYGDIPIVGDFDGRLSNKGEMIRLVDQWGNLVDEVDYLSGGNWPDEAHGGGSSMELRNPLMDNSLPSAWADSNESDRMPFEHYSYSDTYKQLYTMGAETDYKELHFYLVGDSHVVLKNIQMRLNSMGANLISNGDKMSTDGRSANGWLAQGSHYATHFENGELHVIADGHGDNRPNRIEIDVTRMQVNQKYEVSFDARWVSGASRLIMETWDHSIGTSISLPVSPDLGTPGKRNSCDLPQPAPQVDGLLHDPPVPAAGKTVRVTAHVTSVTPSPQVQLYYRLDNVTASATWANKPMVDDGTSGDEVAGDGVYTAQLSEYTQNGQIVQFYVRASVPTGQATLVPKDGANRPAMYMVDNAMPAGDLRRMRFVLSALDLRDMADQDGSTPPYGYAFPRLSNHHFNTTLIVNEKDIIYGCGIRDSGSPWTRGGGLDRAKFEFPGDAQFRGKQKLVYRTYDVGIVSRDRFVRYWLYLLGNPTNENEFIVVKVNSTGAGVREEMEPTSNDMLDRAYPNGAQGELYKVDDEWWFTDNWNRQNRDADWSYKGSDNSDRYRSEWMKRTKENEDDYTALIGFFKKVNATYTQQEIERLVDPVAVLKAFAVGGYIHAWDFISLQRGKNTSFYRRSTDGLLMCFPWDMKRSFDSPGGEFYDSRPGLSSWLEKPYNMRMFKHYLIRLIENYTTNSPRITYWMQLEENASSQYDFSTTSYTNWFSSRQSAAYNFLGSSRSVPFAISTGSRSAISTSAATVSLSGTAPLRVFKVQVADHPEAQFAWSNEYTWTLSSILLHGGDNILTVQGVDEFGEVLHDAKVTATKTNDAAPLMSLEAEVLDVGIPEPSWQASVSEPLVLDAVGSRDPEGTPLQYAWSVTPSGATLAVSDQNATTATFSQPGIYTFSVTGLDVAGSSTTLDREAAIFGPGGQSLFDGPRLELFWNLENVAIRTNYTTGPSYSLSEVAGTLVLQVWNGKAYPLATATPRYPLIWREVPAATDWAFLSRLELRGQVFSDYVTGILAETSESGSPVRYVFGIEDGTTLTVRRIVATGVTNLLRSTVWNDSRVELRIRRIGNTLSFDQRVNGVWIARHSAMLAANSTGQKAGMVVATDTAQSVKVAFKDATFIDPNGGL